MDRRTLLKAGAVAGAAVPMPALGQTQPTIRWRMASSYPKTLDTLYGAGAHVARRVAGATDNKFQIQVFAAGEIVGGLQVLDAVQNGTVECGYTLSSYYIGKDPTFMFEGSVPFGFNTRHFNAWMYYGGGLDLIRDFLKGYNVHTLPAGNTGAQMGGWFRKEVKTLGDLKGLKFRIAGMGGQILARLGVVPQVLAGGDIYPALERGTLDAVEWSGPYDDEKLGFYKVAPYYYYPGWWEGGTTNHFMFNIPKWEELPKAYKAIVTAAAGYANVEEQAKYDARNPVALKRLVAGGAQLRPFSQSIMEACLKAANEVYADISSKNADFKKVYDNMIAFRNDEYLWWQVAEYTFDTFMIRSRPRA